MRDAQAWILNRRKIVGNSRSRWTLQVQKSHSSGDIPTLRIAHTPRIVTQQLKPALPISPAVASDRHTIQKRQWQKIRFFVLQTLKRQHLKFYQPQLEVLNSSPQYYIQSLTKGIELDFFNSGATNQVTVRENSSSYQKYRILPRVLKDVSQVSTKISLFNRDISFPLCVSPAGLQAMAHPDGELATSRACAKAGINMGVSSYANHSVEQITTAGKEIGPIHHVMQLYTMADREKEARIVHRAEAAGCKAIFLTADSPVLGVRYNEWRTGFLPSPGLDNPMIEKTSEQIQQQSHDDGFSSFNSASHSWAREIPWLRSITNMEIWIKGVLTPEDVETAIEYGCDGVVISNHGGRQLDETPATIDVLPACAKAARGRIRIHIDGGIRSGSDIFKALALGAECCWVGRPMLWGLAVRIYHDSRII